VTRTSTALGDLGFRHPRSCAVDCHVGNGNPRPTPLVARRGQRRWQWRWFGSRTAWCDAAVVVATRATPMPAGPRPRVWSSRTALRVCPGTAPDAIGTPLTTTTVTGGARC